MQLLRWEPNGSCFTDYVFDGKATKPYLEFDAVNPQGAYGRTKLAGENFVKDFAKDYFIIRTAWLYGDGKNFAKTMLRLAESNDTVRVVGDQIGSPTSTKELAKMNSTSASYRKLWIISWYL